MRRFRTPLVLVALAVLLGASTVAATAVGSVTVPAEQVLGVLGEALGLPVDGVQPTFRVIVLQARLPRVALAIAVGAGLAIVGLALQTLVRNPLADPYVLGISSGASVGAVLVITTGTTAAATGATPVAAFLGSLGALVIVYGLARSGGRITTGRLVLAGVAISYVLSALTSFLLITAERGEQAREVLTWLLGGLGAASWDTVWLPLLASTAGLLTLGARTRSLNLLFAGDESAVTLGLDVARFRAGMFVLTSLLTGVLVASAGPIGFVGLIVPHATRFLVGADHRRALPSCALAGAAFLVLADLLARVVASPEEIPAGVLTALAGGPFFLWLLRRDARRATAIRSDS